MNINTVDPPPRSVFSSSPPCYPVVVLFLSLFFLLSMNLHTYASIPIVNPSSTTLKNGNIHLPLIVATKTFRSPKFIDRSRANLFQEIISTIDERKKKNEI